VRALDALAVHGWQQAPIYAQRQLNLLLLPLMLSIAAYWSTLPADVALTSE